MSGKKEKIDNMTAGLMISTALLVDGVQILLTMVGIGPFVNWLISIFAFMTFTLWFLLKGVSFIRPKKAFTFFGGSSAEIIPIAATFPVWTTTIATTIAMEKAESKLGSLGKIGGLAKKIAK